MPCLLGLDVGSSSVKACVLDADTGKALGSAHSPATELPILSPRPGFAEQDPATWWEHAILATKAALAQAGRPGAEIKAIGISYQMHGLVCLDAQDQVVRPAIIWCDSRAVTVGERAVAALGEARCRQRLLNSPGNFTASKLKWVMEHEPAAYARVARFMLPGDYLALRLTGEAHTTASGLSEGILWDFLDDAPARLVLDHYGIPERLLPSQVPTFGRQGTLTAAAAAAFGLNAGTPVTYRAGDQPNNALSLNVFEPGELAATAGTSGVVYGVTDRPAADAQSRVNTFVHVNHQRNRPRYGVLLCINGCGILNSWLKHQVMSGSDYAAMDRLAASVPIGSDGLCVLPYGNGAERTLGNRRTGAVVSGLEFNLHRREHLLRAGQEAIVFALQYGLDLMAAMGVRVDRVRAGKANMFLSPIFCRAFATLSGATVELYATDGAQGAARAAGLGLGHFKTPAEAFASLERQAVIEPDAGQKAAYCQAYDHWKSVLARTLA